jgi:hypothetical protein
MRTRRFAFPLTGPNQSRDRKGAVEVVQPRK